MAGLHHPSPMLQKPAPPPYLFLDIHDIIIQGLVHFTRQPEIGHSPFDTFDLWLYILNLGFPREQGYYTKFYHESPPKPDKEKTLFDEGIGESESDGNDEKEDEDGSGGIMIEVWRVEGYYAPTAQANGNVWITTKNEVVFLLFCHESAYDLVEFPNSRLRKEERENVIEVHEPFFPPLSRLQPFLPLTHSPSSDNNTPPNPPPLKNQTPPQINTKR